MHFKLSLIHYAFQYIIFNYCFVFNVITGLNSILLFTSLPRQVKVSSVFHNGTGRSQTCGLNSQMFKLYSLFEVRFQYLDRLVQFISNFILKKKKPIKKPIESLDRHLCDADAWCECATIFFHDTHFIDGSKGAPGTPRRVQYLSFSCSFREKLTK